MQRTLGIIPKRHTIMDIVKVCTNAQMLRINTGFHFTCSSMQNMQIGRNGGYEIFINQPMCGMGSSVMMHSSISSTIRHVPYPYPTFMLVFWHAYPFQQSLAYGLIILRSLRLSYARSTTKFCRTIFCGKCATT